MIQKPGRKRTGGWGKYFAFFSESELHRHQKSGKLKQSVDGFHYSFVTSSFTSTCLIFIESIFYSTLSDFFVGGVDGNRWKVYSKYSKLGTK